jgi:hypothetical protein
LPLPHQRHDTSSTDSSSTSTSSTVRSPPTEKWWNARVRRLVTTLNRVRFPQAAQRYRILVSDPVDDATPLAAGTTGAEGDSVATDHTVAANVLPTHLW